MGGLMRLMMECTIPIRPQAKQSARVVSKGGKTWSFQPKKKVDYDKGVADSINNGIFRKQQVAYYLRTNKLDKPTLVQKSENGTLVLKNEIPIKTALIKNEVPSQHQSLYIDKTK